MRKTIKTLAAAALAVGVLTGCGDPDPDNPRSSSRDWIDAGDGRIVYCIGVGDGISCDWDNARPKAGG